MAALSRVPGPLRPGYGVRAIARLPLQLGRLATATRRSLPDFIVIGAQKAGTTSLYSWLVQHPQVFASFRKEVHYFDFFHKWGERWYRSHFPKAATLGERGITGEATPYYLAHPLVPQRIARTLPSARLIAVLRNPADRAISHYHHEVRAGRETLPLAEALSVEEVRLRDDASRSGADTVGEAHRRFGYKMRGRYAEQLERYLAVVPRERLLVVRSEELFEKPSAVVDSVFAWLDVETGHVPRDLRPKNVGGYSGQDASVHDELRAYFAPHNDRLYELLGEDFGW